MALAICSCVTPLIDVTSIVFDRRRATRGSNHALATPFHRRAQSHVTARVVNASQRCEEPGQMPIVHRPMLDRGERACLSDRSMP